MNASITKPARNIVEIFEIDDDDEITVYDDKGSQTNNNKSLNEAKLASAPAPVVAAAAAANISYADFNYSETDDSKGEDGDNSLNEDRIIQTPFSNNPKANNSKIEVDQNAVNEIRMIFPNAKQSQLFRRLRKHNNDTIYVINLMAEGYEEEGDESVDGAGSDEEEEGMVQPT